MEWFDHFRTRFLLNFDSDFQNLWIAAKAGKPFFASEQLSSANVGSVSNDLAVKFPFRLKALIIQIIQIDLHCKVSLRSCKPFQLIYLQAFARKGKWASETSSPRNFKEMHVRRPRGSISFFASNIIRQNFNGIMLEHVGMHISRSTDDDFRFRAIRENCAAFTLKLPSCQEQDIAWNLASRH